MKTRTPGMLLNELAATRVNLGLSQEQFARCLGITRSLLNMVEHNKRNLSSDALIKLAGIEKIMSKVSGRSANTETHPEEEDITAFNSKKVFYQYDHRLLGEDIAVLSGRLQEMQQQYQHQRQVLHYIEQILADNAYGQSPAAEVWEQHRSKAINLLTKFGAAAQEVLHSRIRLLQQNTARTQQQKTGF